MLRVAGMKKQSPANHGWRAVELRHHTQETGVLGREQIRIGSSRAAVVVGIVMGVVTVVVVAAAVESVAVVSFGVGVGCAGVNVVVREAPLFMFYWL